MNQNIRMNDIYKIDDIPYERKSKSVNNRRNSNNRRPKRGKSKKTNTKFKALMKAYIILLCILSGIFLIYVLNTLYQYEDSFTDNYMSEVVVNINKMGKKGKISKLCNTNSIEINSLDNSGKKYNDAIKEIFKNSNITYKIDQTTKNSNNPVYNIYANEDKIMEVTLKVKSQNKRLGLFTYPVWEVENYKLAQERGIKYFDIYVPSDYTVEVNGTKLGENFIVNKTQNEDYEKFKNYIELPEMVTYELNNFIQTPNIVITDNNGKKLETTINNNRIEIADSYKTANTYEEAKQYIQGNIDILNLAQNWSLFLTDDLKGMQHGFGTLKPYLTKKSDFYDMAYAWATSIDITFVSSHTLKNPAFTNTSLSDFKIYSDKAFSCSVYLEKNMKIANGKDKVDIMHDKLYFVYYDDTNDGKDNPSWKLIDMKAIVEK